MAFLGSFQDVVVIVHFFVLVSQETNAEFIWVLAFYFVHFNSILIFQNFRRFIFLLKSLWILKELGQNSIFNPIDIFFNLGVFSKCFQVDWRCAYNHPDIVRDSHSIFLSHWIYFFFINSWSFDFNWSLIYALLLLMVSDQLVRSQLLFFLWLLLKLLLLLLWVFAFRRSLLLQLFLPGISSKLIHLLVKSFEFFIENFLQAFEVSTP